MKTGWRKGNRNQPAGADTAPAADKRADMPADSPHGRGPWEVEERLERQSHGGALRRRRRGADDEEFEDLDQVDMDEQIRRLMSGEVSVAEAERSKAIGLALRQLARARSEAGALVELELAERVLFEKARELRDAWQNWPARVGPLIAAELEIPADKLVEALRAHVHDQLESLGEPEADFSA